MITGLLIFRDKIKKIYARAGVYISHVLRFVLAFLANYIIGREIGYNKLFASPFICVAVALICAFLPVNFIVVINTVFIIVHLFSLSIELAAISLCVIVVMYLLYFRFSPKTGYLLILTPLLFFLKVPYIIPMIAALTAGLTGIIPVVCGVFLYYLISFAAQYSTAISSLTADNALQNITFIFNNILTNKVMIIVAVAFALTIAVTYIIGHLSFPHSRLVAIGVGCVMDVVVHLVAFSMMSVSYDIVPLIVGHVIALVVAILMNFFIFTVDYSATEYVQFEDDDYYYYVKAVPKVSVTKREVKVKKINAAEAVEEELPVMENPETAIEENEEDGE